MPASYLRIDGSTLRHLAGMINNQTISESLNTSWTITDAHIIHDALSSR